MYKTLIKNGQSMLQRSVFLPRSYTFPQELLNLHKIISFVGARRVGKSTIMKQVIHMLIAIGYIQIEQVIWIDGNEINPFQFDIHKVLESFFVLYPDQTPFFVIDEVHELPDRVRQVFVIYNQGYKIFVSGSNAHLLSSEISTKLRGKVYDQIISGLSWSEYCHFTGFVFDHTTISLGHRQQAFESYIQYGSFPEIALSPNPDIKLGLLKNYFDVLLYKDLIERYNIDKEFVIKYLIKYLASTITKERSITNVTNQLSSQGIKISNPSIYNYLEYLQNIFFITPVREQYKQRGNIKYYVHDTGYIGLREKEGYGKKLENILIQHYIKVGESIYFGRNTGGEIDIITDTYAIQVCRHLTSENITRETKPLLTHNGLHKKLIYVHKDNHLILPDSISFVSVFDVLD